jgi:hypothetical protein
VLSFPITVSFLFFQVIPVFLLPRNTNPLHVAYHVNTLLTDHLKISLLGTR